jgi:hypothetical protein
MRRLRSLLLFNEPQETRFFLVIAAWGLATGIIYWIVSSEPAGTALLIGLALASGAVTASLVRSRRLATARERRERAEGADPNPPVPESGVDLPGAGTGGVNRPFLDEEGRIPEPTLAPLAVGLGVALVGWATIFGLAPLSLALIAFLWGTAMWLRGASDEYGATVRDEVDGEVEDDRSERRPDVA